MEGQKIWCVRRAGAGAPAGRRRAWERTVALRVAWGHPWGGAVRVLRGRVGAGRLRAMQVTGAPVLWALVGVEPDERLPKTREAAAVER